MLLMFFNLILFWNYLKRFKLIKYKKWPNHFQSAGQFNHLVTAIPIKKDNGVSLYFKTRGNYN